MKDRFLAHDAYKKLAERYAERIDIKPHNALYERPGLLRLMPDVNGKTVLDAGCGTGSLTSWLVDQGADVIGVDASSEMLEYAERRIGGRAKLVIHDLRETMHFISDESIDLVTASLVFHYIEDLDALFGELNRVLRPGGKMVFSVGHPFCDQEKRPSENYYDVHIITYDFSGFNDEPVTVPMYKRPLEGYTEALANAGFLIERMTEPSPTQKFREQKPESYARHMKSPLFLMFRAIKSS